MRTYARPAITLRRTAFVAITTLLLGLQTLVAIPAAAATAKPSISSLSKVASTVGGGTKLTVTGKHFVKVKAVRFGATKAKFKSVSGTKLTVTIPKHAAGLVAVTVTTLAGTSKKVAADHFTYVGAPTVTAVSPNSVGTAGGTSVLISGTNFKKVTKVAVGSTSVAFVVKSATKLAITAPPHSAGNVDVRVTTAFGTSKLVASDRITYSAPSNQPSPPADPTFDSWSNAVMDLPAGGTRGELSDVSCASAHLCAAIGDYNVDQPLAAIFKDGSWTTSTPTFPEASDGWSLNDVSCVDSTCVAIGGYHTTTPPHRWEGLILTLASGTWTPSMAPRVAGQPADKDVDLLSISCTSATACVIGGSYEPTAGNFVPMTVTLSGTVWTPAPLPLPGDADGTGDNQIAAVSCNSATSCVAAGYYVASGSDKGLLSHFDGVNWTSSAAPLPAGGAEPTFKAVSCGATGTCVAVGNYLTGGIDYHGITERWTGSTWQTANTEPADAATSPVADLAGASCGATAGCVAVGRYKNASGSQHPFASSLAGSTWTSATSPLPADAATVNPYGELKSTSCVASGCVASGDYDMESGPQQALIEARAANTWVAFAAPLPAGVDPFFSELLEISCGSDGFCLSVGSYQQSGGHEQPLTVRTS